MADAADRGVAHKASKEKGRFWGFKRSEVAAGTGLVILVIFLYALYWRTGWRFQGIMRRRHLEMQKDLLQRRAERDALYDRVERDLAVIARARDYSRVDAAIHTANAVQEGVACVCATMLLASFTIGVLRPF